MHMDFEMIFLVLSSPKRHPPRALQSGQQFFTDHMWPMLVRSADTITGSPTNMDIFQYS